MNDSDVKKIRAMFPKMNGIACFMHGFMASLPKQVTKMLQEMADLSPTNDMSEKFLNRLTGLGEARQLFAALIGADANEIAITHNTTEGASIAAELIDLRQGDNVIVSDLEHPCSTYPWIARKEKKILVSGTTEENRLRIDLHFFNTRKEIDRLVDALAEHLSIPARRRRRWFNL